ncbi:lactate racemase domain-containing protein [Ammoniphilus sp. YIM 78166]|uniref:lactate racemase domain-containing protein n=1 Tax=Ammoniphilus sp. YIM 78166 TaxID=1644106 RepID=UPI001F1178D3|nr:lactate racemase domain-containing protein [Ammoniphilus sp. YIM 78166]
MEKLFKGINIPRMIKIRQRFAREALADISRAIRQELDREEIMGRIKRNDRVAIAVGSRGIANMPQIVKEIMMAIKERGAHPFIVPTMGSHGGATGEGQTEVLAELGITEESTGAPIISSMEVVQIGVSENGLPVHMDKNAYTEADAIIVTGRIKPHTSFRAPYESGLAKMIAVGLGKQVGAEIIHAAGVENIPFRVEEIARVAIEKSKIAFAVGMIENAYDETLKIVAIPRERIMEEEPGLLDEAKLLMPSIRFDKCDVLIVDEMGKNISGSGMDPNIIRRNYSGSLTYHPLAQRIAVLDLTRESHGNANGMTNADTCSRRFFDKIQFESTYPNPLTNRLAQSVKIPMVMENDSLAIRAAMKTCFDVDYSQMRIIRIKNTLELEHMLISECLLEEAKANPNIEILGDPEYMRFNEDGNLF